MPQADDEMAQALAEVYRRYPSLQQYQFQARRGQPDPERQLEFYPPDERDNPMPGVPLIEVYNPDLTGDTLVTALFGDMLHYLPSVDPKFGAMRRQLLETRTPEQRAVDMRAYQRARKEWGEDRPYDQWFDVSRGDAYIRGHLAPDEANEWAGSYTDKQLAILAAMLAHLR